MHEATVNPLCQSIASTRERTTICLHILLSMNIRVASDLLLFQCKATKNTALPFRAHNQGCICLPCVLTRARGVRCATVRVSNIFVHISHSPRVLWSSLFSTLLQYLHFANLVAVKWCLLVIEAAFPWFLKRQSIFAYVSGPFHMSFSRKCSFLSLVQYFPCYVSLLLLDLCRSLDGKQVYVLTVEICSLSLHSAYGSLINCFHR